MTEQLLEKLFTMGIINTKKSLAKTETASVSAFCRSGAYTQVFYLQQGYVGVSPVLLLFNCPVRLKMEPTPTFLTR